MTWIYRVYKEHHYFKDRKQLVGELNSNQVARINKLTKPLNLGFNFILHGVLNVGLSQMQVSHGSQKLDVRCCQDALKALKEARLEGRGRRENEK